MSDPANEIAIPLTRIAARRLAEYHGGHPYIVAHDGATEWLDCADCGAVLDPTSHHAPEDWDGGCWHCGAPTTRVGLARTT